jgi:hypothetical protein
VINTACFSWFALDPYLRSCVQSFRESRNSISDGKKKQKKQKKQEQELHFNLKSTGTNDSNPTGPNMAQKP